MGSRLFGRIFSTPFRRARRKTVEELTNIFDQLLIKRQQEANQDIQHQLRIAKQTLNLIASRQTCTGPIRVLFLVHHIEAWDALADVYHEMVAASDFEPIVASIPRRFPGAELGEEDLVHQGLERLRIPHIRLNMQDSYVALDIVKAIGPEIIFRQSQWDADIPEAFATQELRFARLCYAPYSIMNIQRTADREPLGGADTAADSEFHRSCWRIFCATALERTYYSSGGVRGANHVFVTGHPKVERLLKFANSEGQWPIDRKLSTPTYRLVWSPHHSVGDDWTRWGLFHLVADAMLAWAKSDPEIEIVLSYHPALFAKLTAPNGPWTKERLQNFLEEWNSLPNATTFGGGNYGPMLAASDALITDGISMLTEYQLFRKPLLFLERLGHLPFSASGEIVRKGVHTVASVEQAKQLLSEFRDGKPDPLLTQQISLASWLTLPNSAASSIVEIIRNGVRAPMEASDSYIAFDQSETLDNRSLRI